MKYKNIFIILIFFVFSLFASAQCAMCRANAESSINNGENVAKGLNSGILYLMGIPYILLMLLFFLLFKKQILEKYKKISQR